MNVDTATRASAQLEFPLRVEDAERKQRPRPRPRRRRRRRRRAALLCLSPDSGLLPPGQVHTRPAPNIRTRFCPVASHASFPQQGGLATLSGLVRSGTRIAVVRFFLRQMLYLPTECDVDVARSRLTPAFLRDGTAAFVQSVQSEGQNCGEAGGKLVGLQPYCNQLIFLPFPVVGLQTQGQEGGAAGTGGWGCRDGRVGLHGREGGAAGMGGWGCRDGRVGLQGGEGGAAGTGEWGCRDGRVGLQGREGGAAGTGGRRCCC